jgi:hypothetical protein
MTYDFTGLALFPHSFDNVSFETTAFADWLGTFSLHKVRQQVKPKRGERFYGKTICIAQYIVLGKKEFRAQLIGVGLPK